MEYINHLVFIISPHKDKLPKDLSAKITALPGEVKVELKSVKP